MIELNLVKICKKSVIIFNIWYIEDITINLGGQITWSVCFGLFPLVLYLQ